MSGAGTDSSSHEVATEPADGHEFEVLARLLGNTELSIAQLRHVVDRAEALRSNDRPSRPGSEADDSTSPPSARPRDEPHGRSTDNRRAPTVREFFEETVGPVAWAASAEEERGGGLYRTYSSYWRILVDGYPYQRAGIRTRDGSRVGADPVPPDERLYSGLGDCPVPDVSYKELTDVVKWCKVRAELNSHWLTIRRSAKGRVPHRSDQEGAVRNAVGALRFYFGQAVKADLIASDRDRSQMLQKPGKRQSPRRALFPDELDEVWRTIATGGDDPELDQLLAATVLVTGARREGLINLNVGDVDLLRVTIWLDEKGDRTEEQPATSELLEQLLAFAHSRGSTTPSDPIFSFKDSIQRGRPHRLTSRRFDTLHQRVQKKLAWADRMGFTIHVLRHHAITTVERISSEAVAGRFARHHSGSVTRGYDKASGEEVCAAVAAMTGTVHPLAARGW